MSCLGLDIGNESCRVGVARQGGVDIFLNAQSNRETPAIISFGSKERFIGNDSSLMNLRNTVSQVKRLIGKKFQDPEVQNDLRLIPFHVSEGKDGWPLVHVSYLGGEQSFTPTDLLGMILAHLKSMAGNSTGVNFSDCVIGVPAFMDDSQRRAYLDAATIAGLRPLKLIHETTAAALAYGLYRPDLPTGSEVYVVFVDVGHAHTQVAVAGFRKGQVRVLSYAFDRCLGGRDFDEVLFEHFAAQLSSQYRLNVHSNPRACQRLRVACEKLKKILSANPESPINIECLMDEKDFAGFMKREELEKLAAPLLQKLRHVCERAVAESELAVDSIHAVEVIGSGSRVPAISRVLFSAFRKEPKRSLNASESITRGCALQGAMLSPTLRVKSFEVIDYSLFPRSFAWLGPPAFEYGHEESTTPSESLVPQIVPGTIVFPKGVSFPATKELTFWVTGSTFEISASYADTTDLCLSTANVSAFFTVGPVNCRNIETARLKLAFCLNQDGVLTLSSANLVEDEEMDAPDGGSSPKEGVKKKRIRLSHVPLVELPIRELTQPDLQAALEKEFEMQLQDRVANETKEVRNALESLVYDLQNKFCGERQEYASESEKQELVQKLQDTERWLYEEGENESKGVYSARLADLKQLVNLVEERWNEENARAFAFASLVSTVSKLRNAAAAAADPRCAQKVLDECYQTELWAADAKQRQDALAKHSKPVVCASDLKNRAEMLERYCRSVLSGDFR